MKICRQLLTRYLPAALLSIGAAHAWAQTTALTGLTPIDQALGDTQAAVAAEVPVLCYHRFGEYPADDPYAVTVDEFKHQMDILQAEGYTPIKMSTLTAAWLQGQSLPAKPVLITVDDGYRDFKRNALPTLQAHGFPATLFIYTTFINSRYGLKQADLAELEQLGYEIGSHSATHPKLTQRPVGQTPEQRDQWLTAELADSRRQLQEWSGGAVNSLGYPYGLWDQTVAKSAQAAGYQLMFTVNPGGNTIKTPRYALKRHLILRGTRDATFRWLLRIRELPLASLQPALGERVIGPLETLQAVLAPDMADVINPQSLRAKRGSTHLTPAYQAQTHGISIPLAAPWKRGTDLIVLTAKDLAGKNTYQNSWLVIVDPARGSTPVAERKETNGY